MVIENSELMLLLCESQQDERSSSPSRDDNEVSLRLSRPHASTYPCSRIRMGVLGQLAALCDGEKFTLRLTDAPAASERSLLLKTLQRRRDHCPPAADAPTTANEYSISMCLGCRVLASCQHLNNHHTRFQCSLHSQRLESACSTPQREPEFDTGRVVTVIEDTPSLSHPSPTPHYYAANGHSFSLRPSCSTH